MAHVVRGRAWRYRGSLPAYVMSRDGCMSLTIIACTSRNCSQLYPCTMAVRSVNVRPFGQSQQISLRHRGADMHCVDSRDGMSTSFLVCPSMIQCAEPNLGQDGRKALALALARALAESTRMQPLNDILRARQQSEPKCRATESVSRNPEAIPLTGS